MARETYTYDPALIGDKGVNQMRFEIGDTMTYGGKETSALCNEEYAAIIASRKSWKRAKLAVLESIMRRFGFEVNTTVGPLKLEMQARADWWKQQYDKLKEECGADIEPTMGMPSPETMLDGGHYFYGGMHDNAEAGSAGGDHDLLSKTW